ncbi:probable carboxylesterase 1 [Punica granatum]|uniref:Alpha/beta hydrolase fold-3 domain-containing protein n=2 Tax=Punica granatum TaxID=22663 RepID=A0A218X410_PUNGR|nr:probable carboxylesterase 1 [Punica granatum]OWM79241.1 hypothetical protein CDL15_Pgr003413 [Punica granatum]PKI39265.1 hypothetical protein CRG98_040321 [Punica granatum]
MGSLCRPLSHFLVRHSPIPQPLLRIPAFGPGLRPRAFSGGADIAHEFRFFRVYKDGRIERSHQPNRKIPPSTDPSTGVQSKDVVISSEPPISARVFLPRIRDPARKLPVLFYVHGGGFCFESAFSPDIHNYVSTVTAEAEALAISVEYRLALEQPIPACYDDSWAALQWATSHADGSGPDRWLNCHADFDRLFLAGDSAGGNIVHDLAVRVGSGGLEGRPAEVAGMVMVHPYFGGTEDDAMWLYMCPENGGLEDRRLRPGPGELQRIGCRRVLVFVAEKDHLREVGARYVEELRKSGWGGSVELLENEGEEHCFHISDLKCDKAVGLIRKFASFIKAN